LATLVGAAGEDEHRDRVGEGLRDAAVGILDPRPGLNDTDGGASPIGRPTEAINHVDQGLLATRHNRANTECRCGLNDRVGWIREEILHPFLLQDTGNCIRTVHQPFPSSSRTRPDFY
jgi:hypothetical protein